MQVRKDSTTKKAAACVGANSGGGSAPNLAVRVGRSMVDEQVLAHVLRRYIDGLGMDDARSTARAALRSLQDKVQDREELASSAMGSNAFYLFAIKEFAKLHGTLHELRAAQGVKRHGASGRDQARSPRPQVRGNPLGLSEEAQRVVNAAAGAQAAGGGMPVARGMPLTPEARLAAKLRGDDTGQVWHTEAARNLAQAHEESRSSCNSISNSNSSAPVSVLQVSVPVDDVDDNGHADDHSSVSALQNAKIQV